MFVLFHILKAFYYSPIPIMYWHNTDKTDLYPEATRGLKPNHQPNLSGLF